MSKQFKFILLMFVLVSFALAQDGTAEVLEERYNALPLPDAASYYGQNDDFAETASANYCDDARVQGAMYLGNGGWLFNRKREIDFGRESLGLYDLEYEEIVYWLKEYKKALETVGFKDEVMLIIPPKGLLGERYLTPDLQTFLSENETEAHYNEMRQAYLDAGFENVPNILELVRNELTDTFPWYPVDHHFTPHTTSIFAREAARAILAHPDYEALEKTPVNVQLLEDRYLVTGWEHEVQVENACGTDIPSVYKPLFELEYLENAPTLLSEETPEIVLTGNSHIGHAFNRPGSDGNDPTPGTGMSSFLAHLTHLPVLNYAVFGLENSAIEMYLRSDFMTDAPPSYLVQTLEAHAYPYPPYNYRALPALTYGKCESPVLEATLTRPEYWYWKLGTDELELLEDAGNYYVWLEVEAPAQEHSSWKLDEAYGDGHTSSVPFATDDRFIDYPTTFGLQLLSGHGGLESIRVSPESGWEGTSINVSICDISQVSEHYEALGR